MYKIIPIKQAEISAPLGVVFMFGNMNELVTAPVYVWYIEGEGRKILVDAGIEAPEQGSVHGFPVSGGGEMGVINVLESVGVTPDEIDTLILTHLHFDHVGCASLFRNARIYVQKREWNSAFNPPLHYRITYNPKLFQPLENMNLCLVDGDVEIAKGITLVLLPGHTKGMQGVAVETEKGTYLLAGDHFYSFLNLNPPREFLEIEDLKGNRVNVQPTDLPFAPLGLHVDLTEWYDSCFKALTITDRDKILPGHEFSIVGKIFPE